MTESVARSASTRRGAAADALPTVLITLADVEPGVRLGRMLEGVGIETEMVSPLDDVRAAIRRRGPDLIVLTGALDEPSSLALVREVQWAGGAVVGLAPDAEPATIERLRASGYVDVLPKSAGIPELFAGVRRALERQRLQALTGIIGESEPVREVLVKIEQMAPVSSTVLVEGESGTGKELVARAIHQLGPRRARPFIAVNVGALPDTLLESELFGHEKGAFTGAAERRLGRFELADTGTLFLDEIGEVPHATQVKLLRILEEREVTRVGGVQPIPLNVRVVAATNRPLRDAVEAGEFRADLYYRLNVLSIYLPPLRERRDDIPLLVRRLVAQLTALHDRPFHGISADAMQLLVDYAWPGNVRELRNLIESMVVLAPGRAIGPADIPRQIRDRGAGRLLPVRVGVAGRDSGAAGARELEFIVRSLVDLKLQVEELRRRVDGDDAGRGALSRGEWVGEIDQVARTQRLPVESGGATVSRLPVPVTALDAPNQPAPPNIVTIAPGATMAQIERAAIEAALRESRGNRRQAARTLGIGERTLYRKLREYEGDGDGARGDADHGHVESEGAGHDGSTTARHDSTGAHRD